MSKKIIITGGLGYLGTELCKIYSGISWKYKITVIDNKFISERVYQLHKWGIEFIQGDILDKEFLLKIILFIRLSFLASVSIADKESSTLPSSTRIISYDIDNVPKLDLI